MNLEQKAARVLVLGFDGPSLPEGARALIAAGAGGVILFRRNVESAAQVRALCDDIHATGGDAVLVSVDQEGGRVARLRGIATDLPAMRHVRSVEDAEAVGRLLGTELDALGFDMDMAPVVDVDTNPDNPVIGDRAFGRDPLQVAQLGAALVRGLQGAGLAACAKHFPGHGDTATDSHFELPYLPHDLERLRQVELVPFAEVVRAEVAAVMTAHVRFDALDPEWPATSSGPVLALLRGELAYDGLVLSDDMEMKAVAAHFGFEESVVRAVAAGVDQVLVCHDLDLQRRAVRALVDAVQRGALPEARLTEAAARVDAAVRRFGPGRARPAPEVMLRRPEHLALAERLAAGLVSGADPTGDR